MKIQHRLSFFLICLLILLPQCAAALTAEDFVLTCGHKTSGDTAAFTLFTEDDAAEVYLVFDTLASGTYVRCTGATDDSVGYAECYVYMKDGLEKVWVSADALIPAWKKLYFADNVCVRLHEQIADDPDALASFCQTCFPGKEYSFNKAEPPLECDVGISEEWLTGQYGENHSVIAGKLLTLGLHSSSVLTSEGEITVPTAQLTLEENAQSFKVGVVYAPRTGEASLRESASGSSKRIQACKTGRIIFVLESGDTFSKIRYDGAEGYIRSDCLLFPDASAETAESGVLHVNGKTEDVTIPAYCSTSKSVAKVNAWSGGTTVTVYGRTDNWYAVEYDGWFGYVEQKQIRLDQD